MSDTTGRDPHFLTANDVTWIHGMQISHFGGQPGVRDTEALALAAESPGKRGNTGFLLPDLFEMSACYLYQIVITHPFESGNRRTGLLTALVFLDINGITISEPSHALKDVVDAVASARAERSDVGVALRRAFLEE